VINWVALQGGLGQALEGGFVGDGPSLGRTVPLMRLGDGIQLGPPVRRDQAQDSVFDRVAVRWIGGAFRAARRSAKGRAVHGAYQQ